MVNRKVVIRVDKNFFDNVFEKQRKQLQKKLGIMNLSQTNFTKMVGRLELKLPKNTQPKLKRKIKKNEFYMF